MLYIDCLRQQQPADHPSPLARGVIFGSKPGKEPQARNFCSCLWIIRPRTLSQPDLSGYSKVSVRKRADESSRVINNLASFNFHALLIGSIPSTIVRKGRTLGDHRPDIGFVVQSLVHERLRIQPPWCF